PCLPYLAGRHGRQVRWWYHMHMKSDLSIFDIIRSSRRSLPAHFYSEGERTQTFGLDVEIPADDDYEMASAVWANFRPPREVNKAGQNSVLRIGEDVMLAGYLTAELKRPFEPSLLMNLLDSLDDLDEVEASKLLPIPGVLDYFRWCYVYGLGRSHHVAVP